MYSVTEAEGTRRRHQVDSLVEGIGLNRMTYNFALTHPMVDDAVVVSDQEAVAMARYVLKKDGLFLGSSSAVHLVACVKLAWYLGPGHRLLTILS
ncbi:Cysteine synthase 2 [Coelomomyces lativittatus]|nr:Cysteine synthase 2 [Coelomomyces lativittatus]